MLTDADNRAQFRYDDSITTQRYPQDLDVQAIYCEGVMNIKPWALWDRKVRSTESTTRPAF